YEVFLVSRIHERWTITKDSRRAVGEGLALTGRVVTAAAAIMVCVFLSFMLGEDRVIKEFGLSLASAVFLDALVIRCLLLPATLASATAASAGTARTRSALIVFLDAGERELAAAGMSVGILSAAQGTYSPGQLQLDITQGARIATSAYGKSVPAPFLLSLG